MVPGTWGCADRPAGMLSRWAGLCVPRKGPWSRVVVDSVRAHRWLTGTMAKWAPSASHLPSPEEGFAPCPHYLCPPNTTLPGVKVPKKPTLSPDAEAQLILEQHRFELHVST